MKILVTGGAGFIGSNFIRYWMRNYPQDKIVNLDLITYAGHLESLVEVQDNSNYTFVRGDIVDPRIVDQVMTGVDLVVHFAAESHVDRSVIDPLNFVRTNVLGTANLLQTALRKKVPRFHHVSTDEVFGQLGPSDPPFTESSPYLARSPYGASKAGSDILALAYFHTYGLPVTVSNCANNFGPNQDPEKLIPRFITYLIDNKKVPLMGKGENIRPWLYVEDHCLALDYILKKGKIGEVYCIGGTEKTNLEVTQALLTMLQKDESSIEYVAERLGHDFRYALDSHKMIGLGWNPKFDFDNALNMTVDWYRQNEDWWRPILAKKPVVDRVAQHPFGG